MDKKVPVLQALLQQKMLPLYFHKSINISVGVLQALYKGGIRVVEYTSRGEAALENFKQLKKLVDQSMPGMLLGIGTIKTAEQAKAYVTADADFIVCPTINPEVGVVAKGAGLLWIPGCMTPTEIANAEGAGAELVKIFPGNILGPGYISAVKELFPGLMLMPTGGVEVKKENLEAWFDSGVVAVGMGSKLITKQAMEAEDYEDIAQAAEAALQLVQEVTANAQKEL
mgnify:CR=1 FL=1